MGKQTPPTTTPPTGPLQHHQQQPRTAAGGNSPGTSHHAPYKGAGSGGATPVTTGSGAGGGLTISAQDLSIGAGDLTLPPKKNHHQHHHGDDHDDDDDDDLPGISQGMYAHSPHTPPDSLAPVASDVPLEEMFRRQFVVFYICYCPERLLEIPGEIEKCLSDGVSPDTTLDRLLKEFGAAPVQDEVMLVLKQSFVTRLYCFFARYNPLQFRNVPYLALKYASVQRDFHIALEVKYGPDQDPLRLFSAEEKQQKEAHDKLLEDLIDDDDDDDDEVGPGSGSLSLAQQSTANFSKSNNNNNMLNSAASGMFDSVENPNAPGLMDKHKNDDTNKENRRKDDDDDDDDFGAGGTMSGAGGNSGSGGFSGPGSPKGPAPSEVRAAMERLGIDLSKVMPPLPKFQDPLGTLAGRKMTQEDMELL